MRPVIIDRPSRTRAASALVAFFTLFAPAAPVLAQTSPTVTVTPSTIGTGGIVTVTVANGPGNTSDWIGLYVASAPDTMMLDWKYLNGMRTAPTVGLTTATVTFAMPSATGVYNVRLFSKDTYVKLATSATITVQNASNSTIAASPAIVTPGGTITGTVSNGPANAHDWIGLYATASPDSIMIDWKYLNGTRTAPTVGTASATVPFSAPTAAGTYNLRFFANDSFSLLATSGTVTVQGTTSTSATVTAAPSATVGGGTETVTVANGPGNARDWVGVFATASGNAAFIDWKYLNGLKTAPAAAVTSATLTFTMPASAGSYNFRLFSNDSYTLAATSGTVVVDTVPPTVSMTGPAANATVSGTINVTATAADDTAIGGVQFTLDGANLGTEAVAPPYAVVWSTTGAADGVHVLAAVARDTAGNRTTSAPVSVVVANSVDTTAPVISAVGASGVTSSSATITWTTNEPSDSSVGYGVTNTYGASASNGALVTSHSVTLSGLAANTLYHYAAASRDAAGNTGTSGDFTFTTPAASSGNVINVAAGGDLQAAINNAQPGDTILVEAGATFTGNFILPVKSGASMITIRTSAPDSALPDANTRINPSYAPVLPKLKSPNSAPAIATVPGAHHYRLMGLEFPSTYQGYYIIVQLGDGSTAQNSLSMVPHDLVLDRVYVHGDVTYGQKVGITMNSASTTVTNSYVCEIKAPGQDSQALAGTNGPGPFIITNNYLEAAGENVLFGGADPGIPNLIPSDITFRGNYLAKQVSWRSQTQWNVKNLFELKNAQRVVIDGNVMEYNWASAQVGYAVVITPRNQDGTCPWCVVQQVQFTNNVVRHSASGINILGTDNLNVSGIVNAITIRNNLFEDISSANWGGSGRFLMVGAGAQTVVVDHNTALQDGWCALYAYGAPMTGFVFTNNIVPDWSWAIMGDSSSPGNATIATFFPGGIFRDGIFAGSNPATYPANNYYPPSMGAVGFVDLAGGNYRLSSTSPYRNGATDGTDVGCNIDALNAAAHTKY
jgi:hypothetical protein